MPIKKETIDLEKVIDKKEEEETKVSEKPKFKYYYNPKNGIKILYFKNEDFIENFPFIQVIEE